MECLLQAWQRPWQSAVEPKMYQAVYGYPVSGDKQCHRMTEVGKGAKVDAGTSGRSYFPGGRRCQVMPGHLGMGLAPLHVGKRLCL